MTIASSPAVVDTLEMIGPADRVGVGEAPPPDFIDWICDDWDLSGSNAWQATSATMRLPTASAAGVHERMLPPGRLIPLSNPYRNGISTGSRDENALALSLFCDTVGDLHDEGGRMLRL
jgi:hypothetical protein